MNHYDQFRQCIWDTVADLPYDLDIASDRDREIISNEIYDRLTYLFMVEPVEDVYNARAARLEAQAA